MWLNEIYRYSVKVYYTSFEHHLVEPHRFLPFFHYFPIPRFNKISSHAFNISDSEHTSYVKSRWWVKVLVKKNSGGKKTFLGVLSTILLVDTQNFSPIFRFSIFSHTCNIGNGKQQYLYEKSMVSQSTLVIRISAHCAYHNKQENMPFAL